MVTDTRLKGKNEDRSCHMGLQSIISPVVKFCLFPILATEVGEGYVFSVQLMWEKKGK